MKQESYRCIIPTISRDLPQVFSNLPYLFRYLPINSLVLIGSSEVEEIVTKRCRGSEWEDKVSFLNEGDLLPYEATQAIYQKRADECIAVGATEISPFGWYYQQFLKMSYCQICEDPYYLCWDSDTLPIRAISFLSDSGKPYLDVKPEYQSGYFKTIKELFGFDKAIRMSFVTEHMLFHVEYMKEMIRELEQDGDKYYEKILKNAPDLKLGFSEFETYGTWVALRYPDHYMLRQWKSIRNTGFFVDRKDLNEDDIQWLSKDFDAATFEGYQTVDEELSQLFHNPRYREKLTPAIFYRELLEMGLFGEYSNGTVRNEHGVFPV